MTDEEKTEEILELIGEKVLKSPCFQEAEKQIHHGLTTVSEHTLAVTREAIRMHFSLERRGIHSELRPIVIGALCHDLGIVGREQKFRGNRECCSRHPVDSVEIAERLFPGLDQKTKEIIRYHMWPATIHPPSSREGMIVSLADKSVSIRDAGNILRNRISDLKNRWNKRS